MVTMWCEHVMCAAVRIGRVKMPRQGVCQILTTPRPCRDCGCRHACGNRCVGAPRWLRANRCCSSARLPAFLDHHHSSLHRAAPIEFYAMHALRSACCTQLAWLNGLMHRPACGEAQTASATTEPLT